MKVYLTLLSLNCSITINSQTLTINVSENKFGIDETLFLIVSRIQDIGNYQDIENYDKINITLGENDYSFILKHSV